MERSRRRDEQQPSVRALSRTGCGATESARGHEVLFPPGRSRAGPLSAARRLPSLLGRSWDTLVGQRSVTTPSTRTVVDDAERMVRVPVRVVVSGSQITCS